MVGIVEDESEETAEDQASEFGREIIDEMMDSKDHGDAESDWMVEEMKSRCKPNNLAESTSSAGNYTRTSIV